MNRNLASLVVLCAVGLLYGAVAARAEAPYDVAWSRQIGTTGGDYSYGVAVDAAGNAYISADTGGSLGGANAGTTDAFLVKYVVPEPSGFVLAAVGIAGLGAWARGRRHGRP